MNFLLQIANNAINKSLWLDTQDQGVRYRRSISVAIVHVSEA
jgi:hypothetical protein